MQILTAPWIIWVSNMKTVFWSVRKYVLRIKCGSWNTNLKLFLTSMCSALGNVFREHWWQWKTRWSPPWPSAAGLSAEDSAPPPPSAPESIFFVTSRFDEKSNWFNEWKLSWPTWLDVWQMLFLIFWYQLTDLGRI